MDISKHRKAALLLAGLILLGGALLLAFPASPPVEPQAVTETPVVRSDYGSMLLKMIISVGLVCVLAYAILRWGLGRIVGRTESDGDMEVLARLGVGPNRSIMVVRVGPRFLVVGNAETGITLLSELSEEEARCFDLTELAEK